MGNMQEIIAFVRAGGKRPLMRPNVKRGVEDKRAMRPDMLGDRHNGENAASDRRRTKKLTRLH
jgi:hypothetical protein